jgi:hypothetical protein
MRGITVLKDGMRWRLAGIQTAIQIGGNMDNIYWARDLKAVLTMLTVWCQQPEPANSWFVDHAQWRIRPIQCTCKADGKIDFNEIYC